MADYATEELQAARDALTDARALCTNGTREGTINRLYYACFHAAKGVLYTKGIEPGTHEGVVNQFGEQIVLQGDATRDDGRFLSELHALRMTADYEHEQVTTDTDELLYRSEEFVDDMAEMM